MDEIFIFLHIEDRLNICLFISVKIWREKQEDMFLYPLKTYLFLEAKLLYKLLCKKVSKYAC